MYVMGIPYFKGNHCAMRSGNVRENSASDRQCIYPHLQYIFIYKKKLMKPEPINYARAIRRIGQNICQLFIFLEFNISPLSTDSTKWKCLLQIDIESSGVTKCDRFCYLSSKRVLQYKCSDECSFKCQSCAMFVQDILFLMALLRNSMYYIIYWCNRLLLSVLFR